MSNTEKNDGKDYANFLETMPERLRAKINKMQIEEARKEHQEFRNAFREGNCYICGLQLTVFDVSRPCLHWLLMPTGFTKRHFMEVMQRFSMFQTQSYLRWVANEETFAKNINDLSNESTGKLVELTIRWRDCDWAFSCGDGDYRGHEGGADGSNRPHYHFQMRYKKGAFVRYNEFHIPLHDSDIREIEAERALPNLAKRAWLGGEGMGELLREESLEHLISTSKPTENIEEATVHFQSFLVAEEGKTISGDELAALQAEATAKGVSLTSLLHKLKNANVQTVIMPGDGVVEQAPRSGGRSKRRLE